MRDYSKVGPQFWIGKTGKKLRAAGAEAQIVGMYLMTSPHANMLGLYYVSMESIAHETGLGMEGASKGLLSCIEADFCSYCSESEVVWVHEMAFYQIAESLSAADKRSAGVQNEYNSLPANPHLARFFEKYSASFNMTKMRGNIDEIASPLQAPSKPRTGARTGAVENNTNPIGLVVASDADDESAQKKIDLGEIIPAEPKAKPQCPHQEILSLYHTILPASPMIRDWTSARAEVLRARWNEKSDRQCLDWWERFFNYIAESPFLTGRKTGKESRPFTPGLEWILKAENFAKIREGRYHQDAA